MSISVYRKNDLTLDITVQDESGTALNLTGASITFAVYPRTGGAAHLFSKTVGSGIIITDAIAGEIEVVITNANTDVTPDTYRYELLVIDADGKRYTADQDTFVVKQSLLAA